MPKFTPRRLVEIGTAHITERDCELLLARDCPYRLFEHKHRYGCIFWVPDEDAPDSRRESFGKFRDFGFSPQFLAIWVQALEENVEYLMFDRDAD